MLLVLVLLVLVLLVRLLAGVVPVLLLLLPVLLLPHREAAAVEVVLLDLSLVPSSVVIQVNVKWGQHPSNATPTIKLFYSTA